MDLPLMSGEVQEWFGSLWVVGEIDPLLLEPVLGAPVLPRVLRLAPESDHGFRRDWPTVSMTPQRHYGYAVQWFGLAVALLVMYIAHGVRRARPAMED
jgi:surfeit locus 1 family protein